ncbi:hypothetical protein BO85DRAFT_452006 [Aspergillus piperis CBS 112811]|uniref:Cytochrome P450 n=1 Tax=Aspergillus piperis CBS 112811 TaxID=1448313 RepID=A0A8G1VLV7_9EURO|nr:hypothetical protein BO85DRAFT_452006 [Aspergillus piperis CBS 112811]RAH55103.1 hypothetical protein BO85DRAFT_452006 [Aspergillus piperis CBS 112811]
MGSLFSFHFPGFFPLRDYEATINIPGMRGTLVAAILILLFVLFTPSFIRSKQIPNAPIFGYRSIFEPTFLLQGRFILGARHIIHNAYTTMRGNPFVLRRWDVDFLVLPMRYLEEVRLISPSKLSSKGAQTGVSLLVFALL